MTEQESPVAAVAGRSLDADALPLWLTVGGMASGLFLVAAVIAESVGSRAGMGGHVNHGHAHHVVLIIATTLIMMSPFVFPLLATVARATIWTEAAVAVGAAWAGFIGLWCVAAVAMHVLGELAAKAVTVPGAIVLVTAICVVAQLSRRRLRMLSACALTRPMRPGHPARGGLGWGTAAAARCVKVCAAPMTLMALSPALGSAAAITSLLWWERFSQRRGELRVALALGYTAIGAVVLAETTLWVS